MDSGRDLLAYFEPSDKSVSTGKTPFYYTPLGEELSFTTKESKGFEIDQAQIVIFGFPGSSESQIIKKQLYALSNHFPPSSILDLGTLRKEKTKADTESGIRDVVAELVKK